LAQGQGRAEFQPAGILKYVEDLKRGPNTEIGEKDFFEMASIKIPGSVIVKKNLDKTNNIPVAIMAFKVEDLKFITSIK